MAEDMIYGFGSTDVRRIGEAVSFVERDPRYALRKRKYPVGGSGGGTLDAYRITSQVDGEDAIFTRCSGTIVGKEVKDDTTFDVEDEESDIIMTLFAPSMTATGCVVLCATLFGNLYAVAGVGSTILSATVTSTSIDPGDTGSVSVSYSTDATGATTATVNGVTNDSGRLVQSGAVVRLIYNALQCEIVIDEVECG